MKHLLYLLFVLVLIGCSGNNDKEISASGTIETTEVTVSAKVGGQVLKLLVDEGSNVKAGDTLTLLDRSDWEIQLDQAEANVAAAEAQYKLTVQGAREEDITQAEATLKNAEDDLNRTEGLFKDGSITQKQLDDARTRHILAKQNYDKLKRGSRPEEIDAARARRDQAVAQVKAINKKIDDSFVVAPIDGMITQKAIEEGEVVMPNASLFRISRLDKVHLIIYVSEEELARVKLGQEAKVYIDAGPKKPFNGKVIYISSIAEFTPKNVQTKEDRTKLVFGVKIEIPNPDQVLKPGMPADAVIETSSKSNQPTL
jgi:HlyD family secretion protein